MRVNYYEEKFVIIYQMEEAKESRTHGIEENTMRAISKTDRKHCSGLVYLITKEASHT